MFEIRHQVPGRLRLHLPALRTEPQLAGSLPSQLRHWDGIRSVRTNPACASVIIRHDPQRISVGEFRHRLTDLLLGAVDSVPAPTPLPTPIRVPRCAGLSPSSEKSKQGGWLRLPDAWRLGHWLGGAAPAADGSAKPGVTLPTRRISAFSTRSYQPTKATAPGVVMLCRMNLRLSRWMLRQTLRCWWTGELGPLFETDQARARALLGQQR